MQYQLRVNGEVIDLRVVNNQTWGGAQKTVIYESPGTNGGVVMVTGRATNKITLNGQLLPKAGAKDPISSLKVIKAKLASLKDKGTPVVLLTPIGNDDTGVYLITDFNGSVQPGIATYLPFTMELTEYRQSNLKTTNVNLISFEPAEEFKTILKERGITPPQ